MSHLHWESNRFHAETRLPICNASELLLARRCVIAGIPARCCPVLRQPRSSACAFWSPLPNLPIPSH